MEMFAFRDGSKGRASLFRENKMQGMLMEKRDAPWMMRCMVGQKL